MGKLLGNKFLVFSSEFQEAVGSWQLAGGRRQLAGGRSNETIHPVGYFFIIAQSLFNKIIQRGKTIKKQK